MSQPTQAEVVVENVIRMVERALAEQLRELDCIGRCCERLIEGRLTQAQVFELSTAIRTLLGLARELRSPSFNGLLWGLLHHLEVALTEAGFKPAAALSQALEDTRPWR